MSAWRRPAPWSCLLALTLAAGASGQGRAPAVREDVLRLVPDDVGLCLVVRDLRGHTAKLAAEPWVKQFLDLPLGKALAASPELAHLGRLDAALRKKLGVGLAELRDELCGDLVVFAYRPGAPGQTAQEPGLLLLWARDGNLLARLVDTVNEEQRLTGEMTELQGRDFRGVHYYRRKAAQKEQYYFLSGPLLALAGEEGLLKEVLALRQQAPRPEARALHALGGNQDSLLSLWLNPRAFDLELRQKTEVARSPERRSLESFLRCWQALDDATLTVKLSPEPTIRLMVRGRLQALPAPLRQALAASARPSAAWRYLPADAAVTVAGRTDFAALEQALADFVPAEHRAFGRRAVQRSVGAALGADFFADVLPRLGPDWGLSLGPGAAGTSFPDVVAALRIQPGPAEAPVDQGAYKALQLFAGLAVLSYNQTHADTLRLKTLQQAGVEVKYLTGKGLPAGLAPAFALKEGFLVVASSPAALEGFRRPTAAAPAGPMPCLRISFAQLARLARTHQKTLASFLAVRQRRSLAEVAGELDRLLAVLALGDRLELHQESEGGQVTWTLQLRMSPLPP